MQQLKDAQSESFTILAGKQINVPASGRFVRCLDSTGDLEISFNNGAKCFFEGGIARRTDLEGGDFENFQLINNTGADIDCVVAWGYGDVEDNRLTVTGTINANDITTHNKLDLIKGVLDSILTFFSNDKDQRVPLSTLEGASYAEAANATNVVVSAAANTNGVIIRRGMTEHFVNSTLLCSIEVDGDPICGSDSSTGANAVPMPNQIENFFVPAGKEVSLYSNAASITSRLWYEAL